jgi:serine-type D-Ala-D-Ala carboxypeptidase/endopeptidase
VLENYVGRYELQPNFVLTVSLEDGRLFAQATGQDKAELFAESPTQFFYKIVDAQITFKPDASGRATELTLHQLGREFPAKRLP